MHHPDYENVYVGLNGDKGMASIVLNIHSGIVIMQTGVIQCYIYIYHLIH